MMPTFGFPGATDLQRPVLSADFFRFSSNRIGFWCPSRISSCTSFTRHSCFTASKSRAITANGFAGRFFNVRSLCTASSFVASQQRWNPPIPLIATIPPSWIIFLVAMIAALPRSSLPVRYTSGPQSLQHTGCAS